MRFIGWKKEERDILDEVTRQKIKSEKFDIYFFNNPEIKVHDGYGDYIGVRPKDGDYKNWYKHWKLIDGEFSDVFHNYITGIGIKEDCLLEINGNLKNLNAEDISKRIGMGKEQLELILSDIER